MHMDKTKFAREHGSEEINLDHFVEDDDEEKENDVYDNFDMSPSTLCISPVRENSNNSKENSMHKASETYPSCKSSITSTKKNKPIISKENLASDFVEYVYICFIDFDTVYNTQSTSDKRRLASDSSLDGSEYDSETEGDAFIYQINVG